MRFFWRWIFLGGCVSLLVGCQTGRIDESRRVLARFVLETASPDKAVTLEMPVSGVRIQVKAEAVLSEFDYREVDLMEVDLGKCLMFSLKPSAARAFYQLSVANQGSRLVLLLNGSPAGVRRIDGPIADGRVFVFLEMDDERLQQVYTQIRETNRDIQKRLDR